MITVNGAAHRIILSGTDKTTIGRWSWTLLHGKENIMVRVVTLYRSVYSIGATSTYQQQKRRLLDCDIDLCPRERFLIDLTDELKQ
jgi:hypothetical protein